MAPTYPSKTHPLSLRRVIYASLMLVAMLNGWDYVRAAGSAPRVTTPPPTTTAIKPGSVLPGDTSLNPPPATDSQTPAQALLATSVVGPSAPPEVAARLLQAKLDPRYAQVYYSAARSAGTPWQMLAAIHYLETHQSSSTSVRSYAGATGPMQFMPATFAAYRVDGNSDGRTDITNLEDAMYSASKYLAANGASRGDYRSAAYRYNHSNVYVSRVLELMRKLGA